MKKVSCLMILSFTLLFLNFDSIKGSAEAPEAFDKTPQESQPAESSIQNNDGEVSLPETVIMGVYPQSGKDAEPIEWRVLGEENGQILLLSENGIEALPFNEERKTVSWEESSLRAWLNGDFYDSAFSESEKNFIADRGDKVFLLSTEEITKYLPETADRLCMPTACAINHGAYVNSDGNSAWWLRSGARGKAQAAYLSSDGNFGSRVHYVDETVIAVRPAIWVEESALLNALRK